MHDTFDQHNFHTLCNRLARRDADLRAIIRHHGYPPMWTRTASFATLIHIILEQQVSLASAKAAFDKLKAKTGTITPKKLLLLNDEELKACYFSRQKMTYARHLAEMLVTGKLKLPVLATLHNDEVRHRLKQVKGIGDWTVDVYLMFVLQRPDVFPIGDLALVNSIKTVKQLPAHTGREAIIALAEAWKPYRSIATMLFWHDYLEKRKPANKANGK
jgi:DNA-3-methyladenine glycosylase II